VGASHLEDIVKLLGLGEESIPQPTQCLHIALQPQDQTEVESRRIDVVRGLPEVHMVVRIDVLVFALFVSQTLECKICDHLVGVHVDRGACAALYEVGHELVEHLARNQPVTRAHDCAGNLRIEYSEVTVRHSGCFLHVAECLDEIRLPGHRHVADVKVFLAPQGLDPVVRVLRNLFLSQKILLDPVSHGLLLQFVASSARVKRYIPPPGR